jgi:hypothetical protein
MAAPLGFKTFNTGDVLSAADTNGYLMQGIWVFASAAARDAAVTSPQEGNSCYLKDTDVIQVYSGSSWVVKSGGSSPLTTKGDLYTYSTTDARLAVGANGTTLVADSSTATGLKWDTPAGGGGMTLISTTTLTSSSVTLSSIPTTYKNLQLIVRNYKPSVDGNGFQIRVNADSGANRHYSGYAFQNINQSFNATLWIIGGPDNVEDNGLMVVDIWDYTNTTTWKIASTFSIRNHETAGTNLTMEQSHHAYNQTTAITSLVLSVSGGTFTGTALLYGVS